MSENKTDFKKFDTYSQMLPVIGVIGVIIGTIIFRNKVLSGWHMPQSVAEGDGGPLIYAIVGFFTEVLPYVVAVFPGGIPGFLAGYLAGVVLALIFMLIAAIAEGLQNAYYNSCERRDHRIISRARNNLLRLCNSKEKAILMIQELMVNKDCRDTYYKCAELFSYIGNTEIHEMYVSKKREVENEVYENIKKIVDEYEVEINVDEWTLNSLFTWCNTELSKVREIKAKVYDSELLDLNRMIDEV